ncbi:methylated-DNA--[protein]-cysteine S-methyltransferase [Paenibacillus daejeonensis]|uniref:methylated-DNA--[protein]-cysteine S-methyltransferase n=1 Tax=Paenibacillus daejeonensis TaxID=135193 RepID=UPI0003761117|nr:methylated-DNA--[protein]-cysteine S-methyltransferase [Paenibacillus daejeonensis]
MNNTQHPVYWDLLEYKNWRLYLAAEESGLCFVGSLNGAFEELSAWAAARRPNEPLLQDRERLRPYVQEVTQYLSGETTVWDLPVAYRGTPFQQAVWEALREIPYGVTRTYSEIAQQIGRPAAVRAVGAAIGANPVMLYIPCHRVIGKDGALTGFRGGLEMKSLLLELERR